MVRSLAPGLSEVLGQPVVIENKSGVTGMLGRRRGGEIHGWPHLPDDHRQLDVDLGPYARAAAAQPQDRPGAHRGVRARLAVLLGNAKLPFKTFSELQAYARQHPGRLTYGSPGNGSAPHVAMEMLKGQTGLTAVHIPYRGAAPALQDLLGGSVDVLFDPGIAFEHVRAGKLHLLAWPERALAAVPRRPPAEPASRTSTAARRTDCIPRRARPPVVARLNAESTAC